MRYRQRKTSYNRRLAQWRVTWLIEHSTPHQHLCYIDSFVLRNRQQKHTRETLAFSKGMTLPKEEFENIWIS